MPHSRFFLDTPFQVNSDTFMEEDEAHHLVRVMRKQVGEVVELVNGKNQLAISKILGIEKKGVRLHLLKIEEKKPPDFPIILCQALPRINRLEPIVEKGTELGMTHLWLFPGELSEKKELSHSQLSRLIHISIAAMKQCGRLDLPEISLKPPLLKWDCTEYPAYFGSTAPTAPPFLSLYKKNKGILFFIGPESGFSDNEENHLQHLNVQGVQLHPNILRTDTASLVVLSLISI